MHLLKLLAVLPLFVAAQETVDSEPAQNAAAPIPDQYIIEVPKGQTDAVATRLRGRKGLEVLKTFNSGVFSGLSIRLKNQTTLEGVKNTTGAIKAWNSVRYNIKLPTPSLVLNGNAIPENYTFLPFINADKVHAAGFTGKGVKVGVIDTGINLNHPAFGNCWGQPGCKIAGGYDFVGDTFPDGPVVQDPSPNDSGQHGTHVAGIIAGKTNGFSGIAPDASIYAYKVYGPHDATTSDAFVEAFAKAEADDVDVINCSFGGGAGWPDDALGLIAARLMDKGVVVNFAAMNSGAKGPVHLSDSAVNKDVVTVASTDAPVRIFHPPPTVEATVNGQNTTRPFVYVRENGAGADPPSFPAGWPIVPWPTNKTDDAQGCGPWPGTPPTFPSIVMVRQAKACSISDQETNVKQNGVFLMIVYNNDSSPITSPTIPDSHGPTYVISKVDGEAIVDLYTAGGNPSINWHAEPITLPGKAVADPLGGFPSAFTSWGPAYDMAVTKPDVAAPGGNILSAIAGDGWGEMSGTSMATPMLSGVAALWISAHGGRKVWGSKTAYMIKNRVIASGRTVPWRTVRPADGTPPVTVNANAPVTQVGSGLVDAWHVVNAKTQLTFSNIALNDLGHFNGTWNVVVENTGKTAATYTFSLKPAAGFNMQSVSNKGYLASAEELQPKSYAPTMTFPTGTFSVPAGQKKTATFKFTAPVGLDDSLLPIYDGTIVITSNNGETAVVPYQGAAFDLRAQLAGKMFPPGYPKQVSGPKKQDIAQYHTYNFDLSPSVASYPNVTVHLKYHSPEVRWDIFPSGWKEPSWTYPPENSPNYIGGATYYFNQSTSVFDPASLSKEDVNTFPLTRLPRTVYHNSTSGQTFEDTYHFMWFGKLSGGGSYITPGNYTMRLAALAPFGDPKKSADWTVWKTPDITVLPYNP
ncbi:peptidase S8/S53 domain-containing protein [Apodospora peruviana]|uniref:Peptidase S8/S53 domain-containing protein n=1 Tax=Apodospora peruviana TaxID=516989 RepID=A0AAE0HUR2_9PEZI|nr:peptidase S8/S53 domain-containing protein [Apodospora peruviana]